MNFRVGQKVICINAGPIKGIAAPELYEGGIYTVTKALFLGGAHGIQVAETAPADGFTSFLSYRFRPAVSRRTDISIFTKMLTDDRVNA